LIRLLDLGLGIRQGGRELWNILKIFANYRHTDVNVARNKKKITKEMTLWKVSNEKITKQMSLW
jgi:hypothetical protein